VTTLSLDGKTGLLTDMDSASALPSDSKFVPGAPRGAVGVAGAPPRRYQQRHLASTFTSRRTASSSTPPSAPAAHPVWLQLDSATGKLTYLGSTPTEKQPRAPHRSRGRFMGRLPARSRTPSPGTRSTHRAVL